MAALPALPLIAKLPIEGEIIGEEPAFSPLYSMGLLSYAGTLEYMGIGQDETMIRAILTERLR